MSRRRAAGQDRGPARRRARGPRDGVPRDGGRKYSLAFTLTASLSVLLAAVLVGGTLTAYFKERSFWESIRRVKIGDLGTRPQKLNSALNILVIGSDSRAGKNARIGGFVPGQRSDTVMLLHISPGGRHIVVVSLPRDSVVPIYQCDAGPGYGGQQPQPGAVEQLNTTFSYGGASCLWKTVEHTTHIRLDDFIDINFRGFVHIVNTLGGVDVCVPYPINGLQYDPGLHLAAGMHHIWGQEALAFWRAREGLGLGSDLQRIRRDQLLMISLVHGLLHSGVLNSLTRTLSVVGAAASAMTTDTGLTQARMAHIALSLRGISARQVQFIQVPVVSYPANPNWVQWTDQDTQLFAALAHDTKLPSVHKRSHGKPKAKAHPPALLKPSQVTVQVLNGTGKPGLASAAAAALTGRGFTVAGTGNGPSFSYTGSVVEYGTAADLQAARTVAAQLSHATVQQASGLKPGTVTLILGTSYAGLASAPSASPSPSPSPGTSVGTLSGQYGGLTGSADVCRASKPAFAG